MKEGEEHIALVLQFHEEEGQWIGDCESLGIMSFGVTIDEARQSLESLIALTLNVWEAVGEREQLFAEREESSSIRWNDRHKM